jgi:hypothetical protein
VCGPIPPGLYVDHACHTTDPDCAGGPNCPHRRCVNPDHLELVTDDENRRRARNRQHQETQHAMTDNTHTEEGG